MEAQIAKGAVKVLPRPDGTFPPFESDSNHYTMPL